MISQATRICANPECSREREFIPRRRNQKYCCLACAREANNNRYRERHDPYLDWAKRLRKQDVILESLFGKGKDVLFHESYLKEAGVNFNLATRWKPNPQNEFYEWTYFKYKIIMKDQAKRQFIINKT